MKKVISIIDSSLIHLLSFIGCSLCGLTGIFIVFIKAKEGDYSLSFILVTVFMLYAGFVSFSTIKVRLEEAAEGVKAAKRVKRKR